MMSDAAPGEPVRIGAELRAAREALGWDLAAVAGMLRIRQPFLEALEDGRVGELPGTAYALGFLRTYAAALGLDPDEMSRRFRAGSGTVGRRAELAFPAPVPQRGVPAGAVVLLGILLAGGAYVGWYRYSGDQHAPVQTVPAVPARLDGAGSAGTVSSPSPAVASILPATAPPSPLPPAAPGSLAAPAARPMPAATAGGPGPGGASAPPGVLPATGAASAATAPDPASPVSPGLISPGLAPPGRVPPGSIPAGSPTDSAVAGPDQVVLHATANAWVMVRPAHGPVLLDRVLHAGDSWSVPAGQALALSTGNASALQLSVGGTPVTPLAGTSRRGVPLDPTLLRAGKVQAAPPAPRPHAAVARPAAGADEGADALNARQLASTPH